MHLSNIAAVHIEKKSPEKAVEICEQALELFEVHNTEFHVRARIFQRLGTAQLHLKQYSDAIQTFDKSLLEKRTDVVKDLKYKAEQELKKWTADMLLDPELSDTLKDEGNDLFQKGDFPGSLKKYEEAVKRNPKNPTL